MSAATDPRWYVLNSMHMATLCAGKEDAEAAAAEYDLQYPLRAPHRAVQLVEVSPPLAVSMSDVDQAQLAAMLEKAPAMPLVVAPDDSKLAACFDQIKSDLIADGAVEHDLRLEFFPEAVLDAFRRQRAARQEAQQRLADMRELAAKAGLAHRMAEPVAWMWRVADSDWQLESTCPPERPLAIVEPLYTGYMADAYIEAQQRLADLQDLMSKSGLAHRKAVQVAVSEAVAAEREALLETLGEADVLVVNFMRVAGIDKHAARKCADVVRELVSNHADGDRARGTA